MYDGALPPLEKNERAFYQSIFSKRNMFVTYVFEIKRVTSSGGT